MHQEGLDESLNTQSGSQALEPHKPKHPAYRVWLDLPAEQRLERIEGVLARVVNDEKLADIAKDLGLSRSALNMALLEYAEVEWKKAQVARAQTRLDRARDYRERMAALFNKDATQEEIDGGIACTTETLTLARDEEKSAQWELERLCRRIYGQDQAPDTAGRVSITLNIGAEHKVEKVVSNQ